MMEAAPTPTAMASEDNLTIFRTLKSDGVPIPEDRLVQYPKAAQGSVDNWLQKLGDMLGSQLFPGSSNKFILDAFPDNYQLRMKFRDSKSSSDAVSSDIAADKPSSAKTKPLFDCYLFGYPDLGKSRTKSPALKQYRSTAEFFDHLLWLVTDAEDRSKCTCKHCKAYNALQAKPPSSKLQAPARLGTGVKASGALGNNSPAQSAPTSAASSPAPSVSSGTTAQRVASAALTTQVAASYTPVAVQHDEARVFKNGELVWYIVYPSFRLGLIVQCPSDNPATSTPRMYKIKPLSYSLRPLADVTQPEADMRPFLAYSVPASHPILDKFADHPMEAIPWDALEAQVGKADGALIVEASKVGASRVDHSYSLFNAVPDPTLQPNQKRYNGVFLGCEQIRTSETVRPRLEPGEHPEWDNPELTFAMVVRKILLETTEKGEELFFYGDLWLLQETDSPAHGESLKYVTQAMVREKMFRDQVKNSPDTHFEWVLVQNPIKKSEAYIRGRFYESEKLGPLLDPNWNATIQQGHFMPTHHKSLNNRGDSKGFNVGRKESRSATFAGIFPPGTVPSFGPDVVESPENAYLTH
ncbi:uncharacterized protein F4812DRAFT_448090 [Daldinia caldariorum]|uniref:uncharacterized protein n=1 Tax=Daldinia caldariorum TaxID=326644 RepID=UPI0020088459|nr:uncharacterized protein F4812DRAFT_448090 [Daldinia caldariorum]KAI1463110.1 hypothetical protein F4812DRAFT_448090 [Daldinia caldariorum]